MDDLDLRLAQIDAEYAAEKLRLDQQQERAIGRAMFLVGFSLGFSLCNILYMFGM